MAIFPEVAVTILIKFQWFMKIISLNKTAYAVSSGRYAHTFTHSWSRALLEKLPIVPLLENFSAFYGTRRFITAFT
jgi:hypothetical protein